MPVPPSLSPADRARKQRIIDGLRGRSLDQATALPALRKDMEDEAAGPTPRLVNRDMLAVADAVRGARAAGPSLALFVSTADVIIVPGFLGSELDDVTGPNGLIWVDPKLVLDADELLALKLADTIDDDATPGVTIRPNGAIPLIYSGLKAALEFSRYHVDIFGFDWRKHVDASAGPLADLIRDRAQRPPRPLHIIAHSQGSLVARRALQLLGPDLARRLVDNLVLLGPATAGSFSAAFAIAGTHELLDTVRRYGIVPPPGFTQVLQSMSGIYQLLPWRSDPVPGSAPDDPALHWIKTHPEFARPEFWAPCGVDAGRLGMFGWAGSIDASFLNDRTTMILGDAATVGGVRFDENNRLVEDTTFSAPGDGTVPDALARIEGVTRMFKARGAEHMMLPATFAVIAAVRDVLAGRAPGIDPFAVAPGLGAAAPEAAVRFLAEPPTPEEFFGTRRVRPAAEVAAPTPARVGAAATAPPVPATTPEPGPLRIAEVSPPATRRLRVFSFDPLFGTDLANLGVDQITVELPWEFADGAQLQPGPVGEYLEVVDFDASSRCFYPPVDLNHPHLLAQDGIPVSEGDPRFHQQMTYAVAMNTIRQFEMALGRAALWAPNLRRDRFGNVIPPARPGDEYVQRLRVYPHAMREQNAYYSPEKKALLLGYFSADGADVGRNLPGGMIFSCLSYDIVAHETTHALLDGLYRYLTQPSNPDVFAFHEAFADVVALLQHFSHPEVLRHQIALTRGDLGRESSLGVLAAQFGEATGRNAGLREYLGRRKRDEKGQVVRDAEGREEWERIPPDATALRAVAEPHQRGGILVAALFRAFVNIYESRVKDLRRIASGGTGIIPAGDLHPDMVNRLAGEAGKAARHLLRMCVRALDYCPAVDLTFGEYLRALITADYDLVRNDDLRYRVAVVSAFRDWGIYPPDVRSLSIDSLLWSPPEAATIDRLRDFFADHPPAEWAAAADRRTVYLRMLEHNAKFHQWIEKYLPPEKAWLLGINLDPADAPGGIRRNQGRPVFHVDLFRPCRRIGPDGEELTDVVVEVLQRRKGFFDPARQAALDGRTGAVWDQQAYDAAPADFYFRGGCKLVIDPKTGAVRYCVRKRIDGPAADARLARERAFRSGQALAQPAAYLDHPGANNPFAVLHRGAD